MEGAEAGLSEYELQRLAHIRRNQEYMRRVLAGAAPAGLAGAAAASAARKPARSPAQPRRKRVKVEVPEAARRRSARLAGAKPAFAAADLPDEDGDGYGGAEEEEAGGWVPKKRLPAEIIADAQGWLEESRAALLRVGAAGGPGPQAASEWREEAVRRWGDKVPEALEGGNDWELYVTSRLSSPPPTSSDPLLQEYYCSDAWRLLICCTLMSRVSSAKVKHAAISGFFAKFQTPSDVLGADPKDIYEIIAPLGLFDNRMKSLTHVSTRFLAMPDFDISPDPKSEKKVHGIGEFGYHSYLLFVRGKLDFQPKDKALQWFANWQRRHAQQSAKGKGLEEEAAATD